MKNLAEFAGSRSQKSSLGVLKSSADSTKNPLLKRDFSISVFLWNLQNFLASSKVYHCDCQQ